MTSREADAAKMNMRHGTVFPINTATPTVYGPPQGKWTVEDWEQLDHEGKRYEVIDGVLYVQTYEWDNDTMTTSPSLFHQWIIKRLERLVGIPAELQKLAFSFFAPVGLFMSGVAAVQPDFVIVKSENAAILQDRRIRGVPDLIVEVLSPGNAELDEDIKLNAYAKAGVPEYVIIDPARRQLRLYALLEPGTYTEPKIFNEQDTVMFACLPTISFLLADLFADAPDTTL